MPFLVDRYLADTTHLSLEEHGAYLLLLFAMWKRGGSVPDNDSDLARMLGITGKAWARLRPRLMPFLETYAGVLTQKRLQAQWNWAVENRARQSEKGRAGANERWEKNRLLKAIQTDSTGNGTGISGGNGRGYSRPIASLKERDITTTTSNSPARDEGGFEVSRLLKTRAMRLP